MEDIMDLNEAKEILENNDYLLEYEEENGFCYGDNVYSSREDAIEYLKSEISELEDKAEYDPRYVEYLEDAKADLEAILDGEGYDVHVDSDRGCWVED